MLIKEERSSAFLLLATDAAPRAASVQGFFGTSGCGRGQRVFFFLFMRRVLGFSYEAQPGGHIARHSSAVSGLPWSYTPSRGCGTSTGIDPSPIRREMTSRLGSVGPRCPPVSGEGSGQGGMLMGDSHYCRAVTTSTSRTHPSLHTGRTSRQTRRPHCGGGPLNYSQHRRATVDRSRG
ncbi:hypothetical protein PoB_002367100 [Plakobranchus ocellatus]|uniref:Uncharacterized protein n=1 Tax=Plakobranchus ocellatus TaxID=259542 RepID=A0AAV3ZRN8_9GAST|nr:hypothetical protein PoB_002367100 [Plakobranchus ocellatus]